MRIAVIGSRDIPDNVRELMVTVGTNLVGDGHWLTSGNADGSDAAWAEGGNSVDPTKVIIYLPWATYNSDYLVEGNRVLKAPKPEWFDKAAQFHPNWHNLKQGARRLMARNYGIVHKADAVLAYLNHNKQGGGGTGHGWRIAEHLKIPRFDVATNPNIAPIKTFIAGLII